MALSAVAFGTAAEECAQEAPTIRGEQPMRSTPGEDDRLMEAAARGDQGALAALYDRHASAMLGVAIRILRDRGDAEDLLHDVFMEAWQKAADFDPQRGSVRSWLLLRVRSRGIDRIRALDSARRHALLRAADPIETPRVAHPSWESPDRARACAALESLPPEQRELIELGYFEGMSCSEMAAHRGIPLGTVKSRLGAGMAKLRQRLAPAPGGA
jgi:RNA polymerase sigma-70 factor (ECF subfamily)